MFLELIFESTMNHFNLQEQSGGLEPNDSSSQDCVHLLKYRGYYLNDVSCSATYSPLCEAPLEAQDRT